MKPVRTLITTATSHHTLGWMRQTMQALGESPEWRLLEATSSIDALRLGHKTCPFKVVLIITLEFELGAELTRPND